MCAKLVTPRVITMRIESRCSCTTTRSTLWQPSSSLSIYRACTRYELVVPYSPGRTAARRPLPHGSANLIRVKEVCSTPTPPSSATWPTSLYRAARRKSKIFLSELRRLRPVVTSAVEHQRTEPLRFCVFDLIAVLLTLFIHSAGLRTSCYNANCDQWVVRAPPQHRLRRVRAVHAPDCCRP